MWGLERRPEGEREDAGRFPFVLLSFSRILVCGGEGIKLLLSNWRPNGYHVIVHNGLITHQGLTGSIVVRMTGVQTRTVVSYSVAADVTTMTVMVTECNDNHVVMMKKMRVGTYIY